MIQMYKLYREYKIPQIWYFWPSRFIPHAGYSYCLQQYIFVLKQYWLFGE